MRTVRPAIALLLLILQSAPAALAADSLQLADQEGSLLHRKVVLAGVRRWDRRTHSWSPFVIPSVVELWSRAAASVPDADPLRSETLALQKSTDLAIRPLTLLLDDKLTVRQAFVGSVSPRNLGSAIERLLRALSPPER